MAERAVYDRHHISILTSHLAFLDLQVHGIFSKYPHPPPCCMLIPLLLNYRRNCIAPWRLVWNGS